MDTEPTLAQSKESCGGVNKMQQGSDQYKYGTVDESETINLKDIIQKLSDYDRVMKVKENKTKLNDERMRHQLRETEDKLMSEKAARMIDRGDATAKVKLLETKLRRECATVDMKETTIKELDKINDTLHKELIDVQRRLNDQKTANLELFEKHTKLQTDNHDMTEELEKTKKTMKEYEAKITKQTNQLQQRYEYIQQQNQQIQQHNQQMQQQKQNIQEQTQQIRQNNQQILQQKQQIHYQNQQIQQQNQQIQEYKQQIQQQTQDIQQQNQQIQQYTSYSYKLKKELKDSEERRHDLTLRLSKLAGAQLTGNNPNIADLSDINRPTKLAEKYSELYDNEWTDAYEDLSETSGTDEQTRINVLLDLLKASYDECVQLSEPFRDTLKSLTTVTLRVKGTQESYEPDEIKQNQNTKTTVVHMSVQTDFYRTEPEVSKAGKINGNQEEIHKDDKMETDAIEDQPGPQTDVQRFSSIKDLESVERTVTDIDYKEFPEISGRMNMNDEQNMASNETATCKTNLPPGFTSNVDTGEITAVVKVHVDFTAEQEKIVSDMTKVCGRKLEEEMGLSKVIAQKIAFDRNINAEKHVPIMAYITKCAELCWFMMIQEPPVVIGFHDVKTGDPFNKEAYKAYIRTGKRLDFIVWPPLYLHKDGPMLCKGTAQGAY